MSETKRPFDDLNPAEQLQRHREAIDRFLDRIDTRAHRQEILELHDQLLNEGMAFGSVFLTLWHCAEKRGYLRWGLKDRIRIWIVIILLKVLGCGREELETLRDNLKSEILHLGDDGPGGKGDQS